LANNVLFINDFLQKYYQYYGILYNYSESFRFEDYNVLVVRKTFVKGIEKNEESLIIPLVHPNPLHQYKNDNEKLLDTADNLLCLRTKTPSNLLAEVAANAFLNIYPNEKINYHDIPVHLRSQIDFLDFEYRLAGQFTGKTKPLYFNINENAL
jgi:hypothetical protein